MPLKVLIYYTSLFLLTFQINAAPRALDEGQLPDDVRLLPLKDLNGYFPFTPPSSKKDWDIRSSKIRHELRVAAGLYPEPTRSPLNAVVRDKKDCGDYTIEKVYIETLPGFFLTGTLYRPKKYVGKRPGILCPHGHWRNARFYDAGESKAKQEIKIGAEKNLDSARNPYQARCVGLARLGCTVFQYDMMGDSDNNQISHEITHRFARQRAALITDKEWGLYSPQAESHLQSILMLQTWNSMRAIDFVEALEDVDPDRIAVTGASGGGTQTFMVSALDPRVKVSMPAVMVSTAMQGGCTCENASLLRINEGNVAFAALFAPKPLGLTTANDWTKEMITKGFPELKKTYEVLGYSQNIMLHNRIEFDHNYNLPSRQSMYRWFNRHLNLGHEKPEIEKPHKRLTKEELTVWDKDNPMPTGGERFETKLLSYLTQDITKKILNDPEVAKKGWEVVLGLDSERNNEVEWELTVKNKEDNYVEMCGLINNITSKESVPALFLYPKNSWNKRVVIWLTKTGKSGLYKNVDSPSELKDEVLHLLDQGIAVCGIDLFMQGEFLKDGKAHKVTRTVANKREAAAYTHGYNYSLFVKRVRDILTTIKMIDSDHHEANHIDLIALKGSGHWAAAANFLSKNLSKVVIETEGFEFINVNSIRHPDFLPGAARYGDMKMLMSLAKTKPWIVDDKGLPKWIKPD